MPRPPDLSGIASLADRLDDGRLHAPSAARNAPAIAALLKQYAPATGQALEIASGTGQHVVDFAAALPGLHWQPSDIDPARRASTDAWAAGAGLRNLTPALALDATAPGWSRHHHGFNLIVLVNLLHLIPAPQAQSLIHETGQALASGGRFVLYGPFLRGGVATSDGDRRFHAGLQARDPALGYKNDADVGHWLQQAGLSLIATVEMPANNLAFVSEAVSEVTE